MKSRKVPLRNGHENGLQIGVTNHLLGWPSQNGNPPHRKYMALLKGYFNIISPSLSLSNPLIRPYSLRCSSVSLSHPPFVVQVTVARHMEMSAEDIGATLAYGCQKLVEEDLGFGQQNTNLASGCEDLFSLETTTFRIFFWFPFVKFMMRIWKVWHGFIGEIHKDFIKDNLSLVEKQFMNGKKTRSVLKVASSPKMQLVMSIQGLSRLANDIGILLR